MKNTHRGRIEKVKSASRSAEIREARARPEVTAVALLLAAIFVGLAFGSYGGLAENGLPSDGNLLGTTGRYVAFAVLQLVGLSAVYYLVLVGVLGIIWFTESRHEVTLGALLAYVGVGFLFSAYLHLGSGGGLFWGGHQAGGAVGELLGGLLASLFSPWGGRAVSLGLVVLLVVVTTTAPLLSVVSRAWRGTMWVAALSGSAAKGLWCWLGRRPDDGPGTEAGAGVPEAAPPEVQSAVRSAGAEPVIARGSVTVERGGGRPHEVRLESGRDAAEAAPSRGAAGIHGIATALRTAGQDDIEQVIEAARAAGLFDVKAPGPMDAAEAAAAPAEAPPAVASTARGSEDPVPVVVEAPRRKRRPGAPRASADDAAGESAANYRPPGLELLRDPPPQERTVGTEILREMAGRLSRTLRDYGIEGSVVEIHPGPVVTTYEFRPAPGTKLSRISSLESDIAMALAVTKVRIVAPIPGKNAVGFEIPNPTRETVFLKELLVDEGFGRKGATLPIAIGKDLTGRPYFSDLARMPHLLVAGATGTGKSVFINSTLVSLLYRQTPDQMRLLMVDPKHVELVGYDHIPHLLLPVVTDMRKAALALRWAVGEMERRYRLFAQFGARQLSHFNQKVAARLEGKAAEPATPAGGRVRVVVKGPDGVERNTAEGSAPPSPPEVPLEKLPFIVIVIDELADLMSVAAKDVETAIQRLAQKGRAAGIHLIVATQRPSVDVITGTIKANFPTRMSFKVSSKTDSRTVLDQNGADQLLGLGDMLLMPPGTSDLLRVQGAFVSDDEIERVVNHIKAQGQPAYDDSIVADPEEGEEEDSEAEADANDEHWIPALELVLRLKQASISKIQRHLRIGYNRSARLVERMEREGLVGPGANPREKEIFPDRILARLGGGCARDGSDPRPAATA